MQRVFAVVLRQLPDLAVEFETAAGERYDGEWRNNKRHGHGTLSAFGEVGSDGKDGETAPPTSTYTGQFVAHQKEGEGELVVAAPAPGAEGGSDVYRGQWLGGNRDGEGEERLANGGTYTGGWRDGLYDGSGEGTNVGVVVGRGVGLGVGAGVGV